MQSKKALVTALIIPIVVLMLLTVHKKYQLTLGKEVQLRITGYDPRDLLAGHYLTYTVEYDVKNICANVKGKAPGYICLEPKRFHLKKPAACKLFIKGICNRNRFEGGIERFYVPESEAKRLDKDVRSDKGSIVVMVTPNGKAQIKELLIEGKSWRAK